VPTATAERVDRSTLPLSEVARHVVIPEGIAESLWDDVAAVCEELGDTFDAWQDGLGQVALGLREDGTFAATVGGVVLSIPRQVAKTFLVGRIVFALCILFPNLNAIWTAHRVSTAHSAFRSVVSLASRPGAARYVEKILTGDELTIVFRNGSILRYGARAQNFGRGETQVDVEVFDEAQILRADTLEDMVPAANQAKIPHGALLFFMGTPPRPKDDGDEFLQRRAEALADKPDGAVLQRGDMVYVECSADPECGKPGGPDLMDKAQIEKANPSYPKRTPWVSILRMRKNLKDDDSWRREALGIWDLAGILPPVIRAESWDPLAIPAVGAPTEGNLAYGVKFSLDGSRYGVSVALAHEAGVHVEAFPPTPMGQGITPLADWLAARWRKASVIVIDGKAGVGDLVNLLRDPKRGVPAKRILVLGADTAVAANATLVRHVNERTLTHLGQPGLTLSVALGAKREIGKAGGWGFTPATPDGDVTPVESAAAAVYGATTGKKPMTGQGRTGGSAGRRTSGDGRRRAGV
jgi:hypothetical protein